MRIEKPDREPDVELRVIGHPMPAGSKQTGVIYRNGPNGSKVPVTDESGRAKMFVKDQSGERGINWRADLVEAGCRDRVLNKRRILDGPLYVEIVLIQARPRGHYGTGRNATRLRPSAPAYPAVAPDLDKLLRAVFDALTVANVWRDDSRVVRSVAEKVYASEGEPEGAEIRIWALPERVGQAREPEVQLALV